LFKISQVLAFARAIPSLNVKSPNLFNFKAEMTPHVAPNAIPGRKATRTTV
jgi:hypothetical protein